MEKKKNEIGGDNPRNPRNPGTMKMGNLRQPAWEAVRALLRTHRIYCSALINQHIPRRDTEMEDVNL